MGAGSCEIPESGVHAPLCPVDELRPVSYEPADRRPSPLQLFGQQAPDPTGEAHHEDPAPSPGSSGSAVVGHVVEVLGHESSWVRTGWVAAAGGLTLLTISVRRNPAALSVKIGT